LISVLKVQEAAGFGNVVAAMLGLRTLKVSDVREWNRSHSAMIASVSSTTSSLGTLQLESCTVNLIGISLTANGLSQNWSL
jgi:hypothetical protein